MKAISNVVVLYFQFLTKISELGVLRLATLLTVVSRPRIRGVCRLVRCEKSGQERWSWRIEADWGFDRRDAKRRSKQDRCPLWDYRGRRSSTVAAS
jgi:hypothetical protein